MAPNNALGNPSAARLRNAAEGSERASKSPARRRKTSPIKKQEDLRVATADAFGAGDRGVLDPSEVAARGTGTVVRTPIEEFEARPRDEVRCVFTAIMFLTRLPCPGWCDHHPGYLMRAMAYFPLVGALVGVWAASIYDAAASLLPPLVAAALSSGGTLWLTGCFHEDGLCDTLDGFGGGWTKSQILRIMKDSRNGSYALMGAGCWLLARCAALARLGELVGGGASSWALGGSVGAGPALLVAHGVARASAAPLIFFYEYIVDDEDAKGEFYNWFGESRRLLGVTRVFFALASAAGLAFAVLPPAAAARALLVTAVGTCIAGQYGQSVLGGVMGDFLGATICMLDLAIQLSLAAEPAAADGGAIARLAIVLALPQAYGAWRRRYERRHGLPTVPPQQEC